MYKYVVYIQYSILCVSRRSYPGLVPHPGLRLRSQCELRCFLLGLLLLLVSFSSPAVILLVSSSCPSWSLSVLLLVSSWSFFLLLHDSLLLLIRLRHRAPRSQTYDNLLLSLLLLFWALKFLAHTSVLVSPLSLSLAPPLSLCLSLSSSLSLSVSRVSGEIRQKYVNRHAQPSHNVHTNSHTHTTTAFLVHTG